MLLLISKVWKKCDLTIYGDLLLSKNAGRSQGAPLHVFTRVFHVDGILDQNNADQEIGVPREEPLLFDQKRSKAFELIGVDQVGFLVAKFAPEEFRFRGGPEADAAS
jgi:hypothetical protein